MEHSRETENLQQAVYHKLVSIPATRRYLVAYSGGLDSTVLLHILASLAPRLKVSVLAIHVDHRLQAESKKWAQFCLATCKELAVPAQVHTLEGSPPKGASVEAWAREQRYARIAAQIEPGDTVVTAHHQRDQAEALLLQLFRGAGPHGLAATAGQTSLGRGTLLRPLLDVGYASLKDYAHGHELKWLEDPSNGDQRFDRNFLRGEILPRLRNRWPSLDTTVARATGWQAQAAMLLDELGELDFQSVRNANELLVSRLTGLTTARQLNLLRYWIRRAGLGVPTERCLAEVGRTLLSADDGKGLVAWRGAEVRRYRECLYLLKPSEFSPGEAYSLWRLDCALQLNHGTLEALQMADPGLSPALSVQRLAGRDVEVRFRNGGERVRLPGRVHHSSLKNLYQSAGVPPWERQRLPLIYVDGELAAVADRWTFQPYAAEGDEKAWQLTWQPNYRVSFDLAPDIGTPRIGDSA